MKKVHEDIYKNMKKYMPKSMLKNYTPNEISSSSGVIDFVREYYNKRLPVTVEAWRQVNRCENYEECIDSQIRFIEEHLLNIYIKDQMLRKESALVMDTCIVFDETMFPVFKLKIEAYDIEIITSFNGFCWHASFKLNEEAKIEQAEMFDINKSVDEECPYLPKGEIYPTYSMNKKNFTIIFDSKYDLYTFCMLLKDELDYR